MLAGLAGEHMIRIARQQFCWEKKHFGSVADGFLIFFKHELATTFSRQYHFVFVS